MTSPGQGSVAYRCPRCQAAMTARVEDAGKSVACPQCGKVVKVPGLPRSTTAARPQPAAASPTPPPSQRSTTGVAHVMVRCPACGARLYAARERLGQSIVCSECLESVPVPKSAAAADRRGVPRSDRAGAGPERPEPGRSGAAESDDLKLSDPIEIPADLYLPVNLPPMPGDGPETAGPPAGSGADAPARPAQRPPDRDQEFSVKCPVCDTLVYVTFDEIGSTKTCPDCYSIVPIDRPRVKPRRVNEVVDSDYDGTLFALRDPVPRDIYGTSESGAPAQSEGEAALRKAEREYDEKKAAEPDPILTPFWTGLFQFFRDPPVIIRFLMGAGLLGGLGKLSVSTIGWAAIPGITWFYALVGTVAIFALAVVSLIFLGSTCLTIMEETAFGHEQLRNWPTPNPVDWVADSLPFASAVFCSLLPGLIVFGIAGSFGMPTSARWLFILVSLYLFLPIVQSSILESGSLTQLVSRPILDSLREDFLQWSTFYLISFALVWLVALTLSAIRLDLSAPIWLLLGGVATAALFLYYRLLGRLAWACHIHSLTKPDDES